MLIHKKDMVSQSQVFTLSLTGHLASDLTLFMVFKE